MHKIYKLTFPGGKCYIGRTHQKLSDRISQHRCDSIKRNKDQAVHRAIRKYGPKSFDVEVLGESSTQESAEVLELFFINENNSVRNGYNNTYQTKGGGDQWEGRRDTQEYKDFQSKMRGMGVGKKNAMYGKKHTAEARSKQKEKAKGRFSLPWFVQKHGSEEGKRLYEERCVWLRSRNLPKDNNGRFTTTYK